MELFDKEDNEFSQSHINYNVLKRGMNLQVFLSMPSKSCVFLLYKPLGWTPLETIKKFKQAHLPGHESIKMSYAGRLDPLAHGLLVILSEDACKEQCRYLASTKEYVFHVLFGLQTDTYDLLGVPTKSSRFSLLQTKSEYSEKSIESDCDHSSFPLSLSDFMQLVKTHANQLLGRRKQFYPPYSSARVKGRPLFYWAREGKLSEIDIPSNEIEIFSSDVINVYSISLSELKQFVQERLEKVRSGEFRQSLIMEYWKQLFETFYPRTQNNRYEQPSVSTSTTPQHRMKEGYSEYDVEHKHPIPLMETNGYQENYSFPVAVMRCCVSRGTYVRSICNELGIRTELGAVSLDICRTKVGDQFKVEDAIIV